MSWTQRLRQVLLVSVSAVAVACVVGGGKRTVENRPEGAGGSAVTAPASAAGIAPGNYACSFSQQGYDYPFFPCIVSSDGGVTRLEKVAGSQRIRGTVTAAGRGFHFEGEYFCPWGDCTEPVAGDFVAIAADAYQGTLHTSTGPVVVTIRSAASMGGNWYGGGAYGGGAYGGGGYGTGGFQHGP
jgi:hypothetical protein